MHYKLVFGGGAKIAKVAVAPGFKKVNSKLANSVCPFDSCVFVAVVMIYAGFCEVAIMIYDSHGYNYAKNVNKPQDNHISKIEST